MRCEVDFSKFAAGSVSSAIVELLALEIEATLFRDL